MTSDRWGNVYTAESHVRATQICQWQQGFTCKLAKMSSRMEDFHRTFVVEDACKTLKVLGWHVTDSLSDCSYLVRSTVWVRKHVLLSPIYLYTLIFSFSTYLIILHILSPADDFHDSLRSCSHGQWKEGYTTDLDLLSVVLDLTDSPGDVVAELAHLDALVHESLLAALGLEVGYADLGADRLVHDAAVLKEMLLLFFARS